MLSILRSYEDITKSGKYVLKIYNEYGPVDTENFKISNICSTTGCVGE